MISRKHAGDLLSSLYLSLRFLARVVNFDPIINTGGHSIESKNVPCDFEKGEKGLGRFDEAGKACNTDKVDGALAS
jgi:hypothetical protein